MRGAVFVLAAVLLACAAPAGAQPEIRRERAQVEMNGVACDADPFDGYLRDCRVVDGRGRSPDDQRRLLLEQEGRFAPMTAADRLPTADAPFAFRGWWVDPGKPCDPWADDSQLRIGVNLAQFYAGEGRITAVRELGPGEVEMTLDMHTDPGDQPTLHLKLSSDGSRLFQMDLDGGYERKRCS